MSVAWHKNCPHSCERFARGQTWPGEAPAKRNRHAPNPEVINRELRNSKELLNQGMSFAYDSNAQAGQRFDLAQTV